MESYHPYSGPMMDPTWCCIMDHTPSPSKFGTRRRLSPLVVSIPAWMIRPSRASYAVGADLPVPVRLPSRPPTTTVVHPPPSGSRLQPTGVQTFPATLGEVGYLPRNCFIHHAGGFCTPWDDLSFTAYTKAVPATLADTASEIIIIIIIIK